MSHTPPPNPLEKGGMELSSKKNLPARRQRKKKKKIDRELQNLQILKGVHEK
jgi:hypothetical protein